MTSCYDCACLGAFVAEGQWVSEAFLVNFCNLACRIGERFNFMGKGPGIGESTTHRTLQSVFQNGFSSFRTSPCPTLNPKPYPNPKSM